MSEREPHLIPGDQAEPGEPHDVLAADEFPGPAPGEAIHGAPAELPDDPSGVTEAHDVLAAEEFAMPAPRHHHEPEPALAASDAHGPSRTPLVAGLLATVAGALAFALTRRAKRRAARS
jgi:hypothetical protein